LVFLLLGGPLIVIICFLSPVPGIIWTRADLSVRAKIRSYGLALQFDSIEYEDAANYECDGYNTAKATPVKTTVRSTSISTLSSEFSLQY